MAIPIIIMTLLILLAPISWLLGIESLFYPWIIPSLFVIMPVLIFTILIQWGYYKHREVLKFNLMFTATFLILNLLIWFLIEMMI
jgi:hypothetical protein